MLKFIKHAQNLFNKWKLLLLLRLWLLILLLIVVRCDHLHMLYTQLPSDTLDTLRKAIILQNLTRFYFQLRYSLRHSVRLLVLDTFPSLVVYFHQLEPLLFHLSSLEWNIFSNMGNLMNLSNFIKLTLSLFRVLDIHSSKKFFFSRNRSKRIIKYLNFRYSLR